MSQLLPYVTVAVVLLALLALWGRQIIATRKRRVEIFMPARRAYGVRSAPPHRDLGERIFGPQDWDFIRHEAASDIQRLFERERTALALSWLRRTRKQASLVMRAHVAEVRVSKNLQRTTELKLLLSYLSLVALCDFLICLVGLRGPAHTRKLVRSTFSLTTRLRFAFEHCMTTVDSPQGKKLRTHFNQGTV